MGLEWVMNEIMLSSTVFIIKSMCPIACEHVGCSSYCAGGRRSGSISSFSPQQLLYRVFDPHSLVRLGGGRLWQCCNKKHTMNTLERYEHALWWVNKTNALLLLPLHFKNHRHVGISYSCQVKQGGAESVESFSHSTDTSFIWTFRLFCFV